MQYVQLPSGRIIATRQLASGGVIVISGHASPDGQGIVCEQVTYQPPEQQQRAA